MRKYRGLTKDGKWVYGWYCEICADGIRYYFIIPDWPDATGRIDSYGQKCIVGFIEVIPETVGQSTGLCDKKRTKEYPKGQEIYKGDIVRQEYVWCTGESGGYEGDEGYYVGEVVILPSQGVCLKNPLRTNSEGETERLIRYINVRSYRSEVIGNIHENPSLLEKE